ncbi:MAG: hypothetical protein K0S33_4144 [Bacteroidetes bacterium]|jgi:hypothetical protein|nr:hypothetical protein [Bacteroidota bacterium]
MNKADLTKIKSDMATELAKYYSPLEYSFDKKTFSFIKNEYRVFWGSSSTYPDSIVFRPQIWAKNFRIEQVLKDLFPADLSYETIGKSQNDLVKETGNYTSVYMIYHEGGGTSYQYDVEKDTDLRPIVEDHKHFMDQLGFPFFEKLKNVEGISGYINDRVLQADDAEFNTEETINRLKSFFYRPQALSGIISAHLAKSEQLEKLISRYRILFAGNDFILNDVEKVISHFKNS